MKNRFDTVMLRLSKAVPATLPDREDILQDLVIEYLTHSLGVGKQCAVTQIPYMERFRQLKAKYSDWYNRATSLEGLSAKFEDGEREISLPGTNINDWFLEHQCRARRSPLGLGEQHPLLQMPDARARLLERFHILLTIQAHGLKGYIPTVKDALQVIALERVGLTRRDWEAVPGRRCGAIVARLSPLGKRILADLETQV